jgi:hypothetical protein
MPMAALIRRSAGQSGNSVGGRQGRFANGRSIASPGGHVRTMR